MGPKSGRYLVSAVVFVSATGLTAGCGASAEPAEAGRKPGPATSTAAGKAAEHSEPLTGARLKAALLTADQAIGFEITGSSSRDGAEPDSSLNVEETVSPEVCRHVREATRGDGEEAAAASSIMYRSGTSMAPRSTSLMSYQEEAARARMNQLREAVGACSRFSFSNAIGNASVTTEALDVPALGEDALRYRTLSRLDSEGFAWTLVTAVRVGGVIVTMDVLDTTGPMPPEKLAAFKPDPGPDEAVIATLVENVTTARSA
ncbi:MULTISPECIES: hypothetical protein [Streptomyces]|uniref:Lipoprotein n=1 Tax=Streptomyces glycanivorans TaxID=3033808 RepID=A0ABY9JM99_9ACTN|nr:MULTISPECIES: hypothetical protein [unclassified Streptomyces]WLQ68738.1 hypothetical protein P8A20_36680 [Streptomyces sp. Alt3]WSQ89424.1 hypothetical protein OG722_36085 [Streptomyces sp. NBC_01212]WSR46184.1 hypothetical protein OG279_00535 [Streptomyces sp. NBC_01201]